MTVIAVVGSRGFNNYRLLSDVLDKFINNHTTDMVIISGGARGADSLAVKYAKNHNIGYHEYKPNFSGGYNVAEYFIRNDIIINNADKIIAFWDGCSRGTKYVINRCNLLGKEIEVIRF